jgi:glutaconyl-CoA/methylmalonyl-CoA decarboxylase subunit gamma
MKNFKFTIHGNVYEVNLIDIEDNIAQIEVNGSVYNVEIHREVKETKTPRLVRKVVEPSQESDRAKTHKPIEKAKAGGIKAPLPGTILEIKTEVNKEVKVGDVLMIVEAMKMENNIKADRAGVVTSIPVKVGDSVLEGDVLVEIGNK